MQLIASWFWQGVGRGENPVQWISHFQLYADFILSTGHPGPIHRKKWEDGSCITHLDLVGYGFKQRTRWFVKVWKEVMRHQQVSLEFSYGRPASNMVLLHTGLAAIPWPAHRLRTIDAWMLRSAGTTFRRNSRILDALPIADRHPDMDPVFVSTLGW